MNLMAKINFRHFGSGNFQTALTIEDLQKPSFGNLPVENQTNLLLQYWIIEFVGRHLRHEILLQLQEMPPQELKIEHWMSGVL